LNPEESRSRKHAQLKCFDVNQELSREVNENIRILCLHILSGAKGSSDFKLSSLFWDPARFVYESYLSYSSCATSKGKLKHNNELIDGGGKNSVLFESTVCNTEETHRISDYL
jgi:hypothetical protein